MQFRVCSLSFAAVSRNCRNCRRRPQTVPFLSENGRYRPSIKFDGCCWGRCQMSVAQISMRMPSFSLRNPIASVDADDPVAVGLRQCARRLVGVAGFSGVVNVLMLSGSLYMLQVYDRVIPSRNIATLFGLSLMVLFAYLMQGYFD